MEETISAAEANREFSRLLREVWDGNSFVVTSHGRPVARIVPVDADRSAREDARRKLFERLRSQPQTPAEPWTRDELYDD